MHPAQSLAEAPPKSDAPHSEQQPSTNGESESQHHGQRHGPNGIRDAHAAPPPDVNPAPVRKDTTSSTSTTATVATLATLASNDSAATAYSEEQQSPNFPTQNVFSAKDGNDVAQRRASRRRTGPLSAVQRERAALIRKLGACEDCRRRRVACHPNHHGMTWEEAAVKFRSHSPSVRDLGPPNGQRPLSPTPLNSKPVFTQDPQDMDVEVSPTQQAERPSLSDGRIRKPLPSGPRPEKLARISSLPGVDGGKLNELQVTASRVLGNAHRGRYAAVSALLVHWQEDGHMGIRSDLEKLGAVLQQHYNYTFQIKSIPASAGGSPSLTRWLSRELADFIENEDKREVLKIVYYSGHSYLDENREMLLASSRHADPSSVIRWEGIKQNFEGAISDTLVIMDAAFYPSPTKLVREAGVLELIAAAASEDHADLLGCGAFTRELTEQLRTRVSQRYQTPLSASELHANLWSQYPKIMRDRNPEQQVVTSCPSPLHLQVSGSLKLPSILLAPIPESPPYATPDSPTSGVQLTLTFRLSDDTIDAEKWAECFRWMPNGVRDVKVENLSPRNTFR